LWFCSTSARNTSRPIRPKPLIARRVVMSILLISEVAFALT